MIDEPLPPRDGGGGGGGGGGGSGVVGPFVAVLQPELGTFGIF